MTTEIITAFLMGMFAVAIFDLKVFKILNEVRSDREVASVTAIVSMVSLNVGLAAVILPTNARIDLGFIGLFCAAFFAAFPALIEANDHIPEDRPEEMWVFAGLLLLMCTAALPVVVKKPLISVSAILISTLIMTKGEILSAYAWASAYLRKRLAR